MENPEHLRQGLCNLLHEIGSVADVINARVDAKGSEGTDLVTSVDYALQKTLETRLSELLPGSLVFGEEEFTGWQNIDTPTWLVDPLDGTVNFVAGLPFYAIAVVLRRDNQAEVAAVLDLTRGEIFSAIRNQGAWLDDRKIVWKRRPSRLAVLSSGLIRDLAISSPETLASLIKRHKIRNLGSQALHLCYIADGRFDIVASREAKGWDDMAGALIAREAGLEFGHYHEVTPKVDADQFSLCAPPRAFSTYREQLRKSVPDSGIVARNRKETNT